MFVLATNLEAMATGQLFGANPNLRPVETSSACYGALWTQQKIPQNATRQARQNQCLDERAGGPWSNQSGAP